MKYLKRKYYEYQIKQANDSIDLVRGMFDRSESQLLIAQNITVIRNVAKRNYYKTLLSVVKY